MTQYGVKNSCPSITWNLYGFPMPEVTFKFEGQDIEMGDKYSCSYSRNGVAALQVNSFGPADVGTYECFGSNEHGEASLACCCSSGEVTGAASPRDLASSSPSSWNGPALTTSESP